MSIIYGVCGNHQFVFVRPPKPQNFSHNRKSKLQYRFEGSIATNPSSFSSQTPVKEHKLMFEPPPLLLLPHLMAPQLLGAKPKQKTQRIAGIDQDEIDDPTLIADADSCFCEFNGVQLHHKICDAELSDPDTLEEQSNSQSLNRVKGANFPMILLHGFGASVFMEPSHETFSRSGSF
ncbi:hypothetical protein BUALT_Bualt15G0036800 [Buddleja alternifolia]|uniref:Uncharacterized protein n=1 Tax=Buddleja alternifolia TaxID=168488 RepID=A0AAV6WCF9_9LAMI|nr:hypothetical protein BUALT_Bualt15G0036800 [Buddleja alternifolia]